MSKKLSYELTDETRSGPDGAQLHRIRAMRDIPAVGVKKGDLGGWVSSALLENGDARIADDAWVFGNARIAGAASICDSAVVSGDADVSGFARVSGSARVLDQARVYGRADVGERAWVFESAHVYDEAQVYGDAAVRGEARVYGAGQAFDHAEVRGNAAIAEYWHVITAGPIGSEGVTATVFRTSDGGHAVNVDCWDGTLATLMAEVRRCRREEPAWLRAEETAKHCWEAQFAALKQLGEATVARWAESEEPS